MRHTHWMLICALAAVTGLSACNETKVAENGTSNTDHASPAANTMTLPSGTSIQVALGGPLSSKTDAVGTAWHGTVVNGPAGIPSGSAVAGNVTSAKPAQKGDRAMLDLRMTSITVAGHTYAVHGSTEAIIAGSTRARNLGAIAGSAAAGALIGQAASGSTKGTVIGAVVGGGAATGVVAASDGYQVVLKSGTELTFTTDEAVAVRQ